MSIGVSSTSRGPPSSVRLVDAAFSAGEPRQRADRRPEHRVKPTRQIERPEDALEALEWTLENGHPVMSAERQ